MTINSFSPSSNTARRNGELFVQMRAQFSDLQRQLTTEQKSDTFGGLGVDRRISLDTRAKLGTLEGWTKSIDQGNMRITFMMQTIERFSKNTLDGKGDARPGAYVVGANGDVAGQLLARNRLAESLDTLNVDVGGRYLFSGRSTDVKPVEKFSTIMDGDGAGLDGIKTLMTERRLADAGVGNLGRLSNTVAGTAVTIANDPGIALRPSTGRPEYGFTISGAASTSSSISSSFTAGPPANAGFNVVTNPAAGDKITLALTLPDNTTTTIELEARLPNVGGPADTGFQIGATPALTAANLSASITAALQKQTDTNLYAASATIASRDFFAGSTGNIPVRVPGPGFATATGLPVAPAVNTTVIWYKGDDAPGIPARDTARLQIDNSQSVATGARANEAAFREGLATFAVFAAADLASTSTPNARDRYEAIADRVRTNLAFPTTQKPQDIGVEIATAQTAMQSARDRHKVSTNFLENARAGAENVNKEEVIVALTSLQTRMQASYQTTSILSSLKLTDYLR